MKETALIPDGYNDSGPGWLSNTGNTISRPMPNLILEMMSLLSHITERLSLVAIIVLENWNS